MSVAKAPACPYCSCETESHGATVHPCPQCRRPIVPAFDPDTGKLDVWVPGDLGRYCVLAEVGRGGMGRVFRGQDKVSGQVVAIKFLREDMEWDQAHQDRFDREVQILGSLNHPNVVRFLGHDHEAGRRYYVMEWVEGQDLAKILAECRARGQVLPFDYVYPCFQQLCAALQALHDRGVVHRDVKPSNIMITLDGSAKLIDLGIAKWQVTADATTRTGAAIGTVNYLAPEQEQGGAVVDHRADIFALGVVMYEALTGFLPRGNVQRPSAVNPSVPTWFDRILLRMMERDASARPPSVGGLNDLQGNVASHAWFWISNGLIAFGFCLVFPALLSRACLLCGWRFPTSLAGSVSAGCFLAINRKRLKWQEVEKSAFAVASLVGAIAGVILANWLDFSWL
jgi:serine/threonine protein kinase